MEKKREKVNESVKERVVGGKRGKIKKRKR